MTPSVDRAILRKLQEDVGADEEAMAKLVHKFLDNAAQMLQQGIEAAARGDTREVARACHTLNSAAMTFGAREMSRMCREAEANAVAGETAQAHARFAEIQREFEMVRAELATSKPPG